MDEMEIKLTEHEGNHYADSRMLAEALELQHDSIMILLKKHEEFGRVRFEIGTSQTLGGRQETVFALLDEREALILLTFVRNSERAKRTKVKLVDAFLALRKMVKDPTDITKIDLARMVIESETERLRLEEKNKELTVIAEAHSELVNAENCCPVAHIAKVLGYGQITFFRKLREAGILQSQGIHKNIPYQKYLEAGYFVVRDRLIKKGDMVELYKQTFVTSKGESWLAKKYGQKKITV